MFTAKFSSMVLILACVLLTGTAVAAAPSTDQPLAAQATAIRTSLQPDLTLRGTLAPEFLPAVAFHQKTCHCSCGFPCNQDDDCGPGGRCEQFISCCARAESSKWVQQTAQKSTHAGETPAIDIKCK